MRYTAWAIICASWLDLAITQTALLSSLAIELNPLAGTFAHMIGLKLLFTPVVLLLGYREFRNEPLQRLSMTAVLTFYVVVCAWNTLQLGVGWQPQT